MTPPAHAITRDVARLVESEELGTSLFRAAAGRARSEHARHAWTTLHELEKQTNAGVAAFLTRAGLDVKPTNTVAEAAGSAGGTALHLLPYHLQLNAVRLGTHRYLPAFRRLAHHYQDTTEAPFFDYVVQHELAIIAFTSSTLAGSASALDPVERLLDHAVPGLPDDYGTRGR
jgi:hypothetical protein